MYVFHTIYSEGTVPHVAEEQFTYIWNIFFLGGNIIFIFGMIFEFKIYTLVNLCKNILNGLRGIGPNTTYVALSRVYVQFNAGKTCTVLSAIVLFLHHQIHFVYTVKCRPVFFLVVLQGFQQSYQCNSTFVF